MAAAGVFRPAYLACRAAGRVGATRRRRSRQARDRPRRSRRPPAAERTPGLPRPIRLSRSGPDAPRQHRNATHRGSPPAIAKADHCPGSSRPAAGSPQRPPGQGARADMRRRIPAVQARQIRRRTLRQDHDAQGSWRPSAGSLPAGSGVAGNDAVLEMVSKSADIGDDIVAPASCRRCRDAGQGSLPPGRRRRC